MDYSPWGQSLRPHAAELLSRPCLIEAHTFHGVYQPHFSHFSAEGLLGCFHFLAFVNNTAVNLCVQVLVWACFVSIRSGRNC